MRKIGVEIANLGTLWWSCGLATCLFDLFLSFPLMAQRDAPLMALPEGSRRLLWRCMTAVDDMFLFLFLFCRRMQANEDASGPFGGEGSPHWVAGHGEWGRRARLWHGERSASCTPKDERRKERAQRNFRERQKNRISSLEEELLGGAKRAGGEEGAGAVARRGLGGGRRDGRSQGGGHWAWHE